MVRPTVCLFTDSKNPSGVGEHMLALTDELKTRCSILFMCPATEQGRRFLARADAMGLESLAVRLDKGHQARLMDIFKRRQPDIFHVHAGIGWEGLSSAAIARMAGVPIVLRTEHLPYLLTNPGQRARYRRGLAHLDHIICVSAAARDSFIKTGVPPSLMSVVRNGIPETIEVCGRETARVKLGMAAETPVLLTVGRLTEQKNHRLLIEAIPAVLEQAPNTQVLLVGTGPLESALRRAVRARKLHETVRFLGQRDDVPDLMAAADVFVLPSRFEGHPLVVLEAMRAGLPVVATNVCGTAEAVQDGRTGLLLTSGDPAALAGALRLMLAQPAWARRLGAEGRKRARRHFGAARMASQTLDLYCELLGARSKPSQDLSSSLSMVST